MGNSIQISAVIPTFNRIHVLIEAIESALSQTMPIDEIIVIDDGSTDGTAEVLRQRYGDRIHYHWQPNSGVSAARNHGMRIAKGRYIALLDSDDLWLPEKTRLQVEWLDAHPDYGMVLCDVVRLNPDGSQQDVFRRRDTIKKDGWIFQWIIHDPALAPASAIFRRKVLEDVGGFDEDLQTAEDLDFHLRVASRWKIGIVERQLVHAMRGHDGLSATATTYENYVSVVERAINAAGNAIPPAEKKRALCGTYARNARGMAIRGDWRKSFVLLGKAISNASEARSAVEISRATIFMAKRIVSRLWN